MCFIFFKFDRNPNPMEIQQEDNGTRGRFFILIDGSQQAEMTYTWAGSERFIIDHT